MCDLSALFIHFQRSSGTLQLSTCARILLSRPLLRRKIKTTSTYGFARVPVSPRISLSLQIIRPIWRGVDNFVDVGCEVVFTFIYFARAKAIMRRRSAARSANFFFRPRRLLHAPDYARTCKFAAEFCPIRSLLARAETRKKLPKMHAECTDVYY